MKIQRGNELQVYVAAPSDQIERAIAVIDRLRMHPDIIEVVSSWTERLPATRAKYNAKSDREVPADVLVEQLRLDLEEVGFCDVLLRLCGKSDGAGTEWGYGVGRDHATGQPLLVASGDAHGFELLADEILATDDEAIAFVVAEAQAHRAAQVAYDRARVR